MGRQAYGIVGGIIGAVVVGVLSEGTATAQGYAAGFALGAALGGAAGSYIDPILIQGNKIGDNDIQVAAEGGARAIMFGRTCVTATCVIARGNRKVVNKKTSNDGKGSAGSTQNESVYWTFAIGLGEQLVGSSIVRIWQDDNLVYDVLAGTSMSVADNAKFAAKFKFYDGSEAQLPDPDLQVFLGADTPYFRGTAYAVFPNFDLTNTAERIPQFKFEVAPGDARVLTDNFAMSWRQDIEHDPDDTHITTDQIHQLIGSSTDTLELEITVSGTYETTGYRSITEIVSGNGALVRTLNYAIDLAGQKETSYMWIDVYQQVTPSDIHIYDRVFLNAGPEGALNMTTVGPTKVKMVCPGGALFRLHVDTLDGYIIQAPQNVAVSVAVKNVSTDHIQLLNVALPSPPASVHTDSQSVTLNGSGDEDWSVELWVTGVMETRKYSAAPVQAVGGQGRFVTALSDTAVDTPSEVWHNANVYKLEISDPAQTIYLNNSIGGESTLAKLTMDGSDSWKLTLTAKSNATITVSVNDENGMSSALPQNCSVKLHVIGDVASDESTITLGSVVESLALRTGADPNALDVSELPDPIAGVCIQTTATGADAIGAVVAPYFADPREADGVLRWVKRGKPVVRTLTIDDLVEEPDVYNRANVIEYPAKLHFFYQSPATGYATTKATSYRYSPQADSSGEGSVTAPVTFYDADQPAQIAQKLHKVMWTEAQGSFTWKVGAHCVDLTPGDCLGLFLRGNSARVRITAIEDDGNTRTLTMMKDRQSSYTSAVTGIPLPVSTPPLPTTMSPAVLAVLDIPALQDTDDSLIYYTAMAGETKTWRGGQLQRSLDGGVTWSTIGDVTTPATMGKLVTPMNVALASYTDTDNQVVVQLFNTDDELSSYTDAQFHQEQGAIAVQLADGTWEVMQYRDATPGDAGMWTLSTLLRGRLNTVAGAHATGALFVKLDQWLQKQTAQAAWLGGDLQLRAISYGSSAADATAVDLTYAGRSQLEWPPAGAVAEYDGTFVRVRDIAARHRFGTEVNPIASVNFTGFRVTAFNGATSVTSDTTSNTAYISTAMVPTSVTVQALNKITGAGTALVLTPVAVPAGTLSPVAIVNAGGAA